MKVHERIAQYGIESCSTLELLSTLVPPQHAERMLNAAAGSLRMVINGPMGTKAQMAKLAAVRELGKRYLAESLTGRQALKDPMAVRRLLQARLRDKEHEIFAALFLDNQHRVIALEELAQGTVDGCSVYPREVIKAALKHNAAALIFAHNHPSGVAEPSAADRTLTERLKAALAQVDIRVLDHFVVGEQVVSFAERGWI